MIFLEYLEGVGRSPNEEASFEGEPIVISLHRKQGTAYFYVCPHDPIWHMYIL